jgi:hypothetical protein
MKPRSFFPLIPLIAAHILTACLPTSGGDDRQTETLALARILSVNVDGTGDTSLYATYSYDSAGMRVRERVDFMVFEWDSLGRYSRWVQPLTGDTVESVTWFGSDSSSRGSRNSSLITRERWFGLRPNCKCADSAYRYSFNGSLLHVRRFSYDSLGSLRLVTRDWASPVRRDTALLYENHYAGGRLSWRISYDNEVEDTTRQIFQYSPLDSLIESR